MWNNIERWRISKPALAKLGCWINNGGMSHQNAWFANSLLAQSGLQ